MITGVVLPSRGLVHSRTVESLITNLYGRAWGLYMTHDLPIPDCFNVPVEQALKEGVDQIFFVEEDMVFPPNTFQRLMQMDVPVASVDYADRRTGRSLVLRDKKGEVVLSGMGCLLVKREVFGRLKRPFFKRAVIELMDDGDIRAREDIDPTTSYGTQDAYFCTKIRQAGYDINLLPDAKIGHLRIDSYGEDVKNDGKHRITPVYL